MYNDIFFSVPFYLPFSSVQILHTFLLCICHLHFCTTAEFFCTTNKAFIVRLYQNFPRYEKSRLVQKRVASIQWGPGTDPAGHHSSHKLCTGAIFRGGMQTAGYFVLSKYLPHIYSYGYKSVCSQWTLCNYFMPVSSCAIVISGVSGPFFFLGFFRCDKHLYS